jgi:hypothetical protein
VFLRLRVRPVPTVSLKDFVGRLPPADGSVRSALPGYQSLDFAEKQRTSAQAMEVLHQVPTARAGLTHLPTVHTKTCKLLPLPCASQSAGGAMGRARDAHAHGGVRVKLRAQLGCALSGWRAR